MVEDAEALHVVHYRLTQGFHGRQYTSANTLPTGSVTKKDRNELQVVSGDEAQSLLRVLLLHQQGRCGGDGGRGGDGEALAGWLVVGVLVPSPCVHLDDHAP
ncbi:hypothetical protein E2C01_009502 [Portunus trituberculatus]|uniref:Uncharacterized protein n=1 Tax=Portunus trituberculatus TaxID=210409 RepID=A0A5B7D5X8_PORTR|nr:hypothetical protein [Portunus trituberculatus]